MRYPSAASHQRSAATPGSSILLAVWMLAGIAAGWGILNLTPVKVLAVVLGALCIVLAAWRIEVALYSVGFFMVVLQEGETTPDTIFSFLESLNRPSIPSLLEVLFAVVVAAFFLRCFVMHDERYNFDGMKIPLVLFFGLFFMALANGVFNDTDSIFRKEDCKKFIFPVLMFVSVLNILDTREKIIRLLTMMFWVMLVKTYLANFYYLIGMGFPYGDAKVVFMESGDQTLVVTIIVAGIALLSERKMYWKSFLCLIWGIAPMVFALIFSYRRNALWGAIFSLGILIMLSPREKKMKLFKIFAAAGLGAGLLMALLPGTGLMPNGESLEKRMTSVTDRDQSSNVAHMNEWRVTVEDTMQHPLLGLGLGSIHGAVPEFEVINRHTVHNALLMLWMKMGFIAVLLLLWCLYRYCRLGVREALRGHDPLLTGLFATVGLWVVAINVGPSWFYYRESCLMALIMAMVGRLAMLDLQQPPPPGSRMQVLRPTLAAIGKDNNNGR
jgi:hypothetical protein